MFFGRLLSPQTDAPCEFADVIVRKRGPVLLSAQLFAHAWVVASRNLVRGSVAMNVLYIYWYCSVKGQPIKRKRELRDHRRMPPPRPSSRRAAPAGGRVPPNPSLRSLRGNRGTVRGRARSEKSRALGPSLMRAGSAVSSISEGASLRREAESWRGRGTASSIARRWAASGSGLWPRRKNGRAPRGSRKASFVDMLARKQWNVTSIQTRLHN